MGIPNLEKPEIIWDKKRKIYTKDFVFSPEQCEEIIKYGEPRISPGINKYPGLFSIKFESCLLPLNHSAHDILHDVWEEIINYFNFNIDFVEPYELKKYYKGCFFGKHIDNYYSISEDIDRKITMSVQLSNDTDYSGGDFSVIGENFKLKRGSVIAFPSYFNHEVKMITEGVRWSLISWAWGPYWK